MKIIILVLYFILVLLTALFSWELYVRLKMDYNADGNYFDENTMVTYTEQAKLVYGIITAILWTMTFFATPKLMSIFNKNSLLKKKAR